MSKYEGESLFISTPYVPKHFPKVFNACLVFHNFSNPISCFLKMLLEKSISLDINILPVTFSHIL